MIACLPSIPTSGRTTKDRTLDISRSDSKRRVEDFDLQYYRWIKFGEQIEQLQAGFSITAGGAKFGESTSTESVGYEIYAARKQLNTAGSANANITEFHGEGEQFRY